ncbi:MAG: oligosaccharide flippase family protein [Sphingobacteriales bacterium]|nr:oligosaccharide flippase family protein [Sphingobacteriales bacterium]
MSLGNILANNTIYRVLNIAVTFLTTVVLSRLMGATGYGLLSLIIVNVTLFNLFSGFGADAGIVYKTASRKIETGKIISITWILAFFQLILIFVAGYVFFFIKGEYWFGMKSIFPIALMSVSMIIGERYHSIFYGHHKYALSNKITFYLTLIGFLFFIFLYFNKTQYTFHQYFTVYISFILFQTIITVFIFHKSEKCPFNFSLPEKADWRLFFSYSLIAFITNCIQFLAYRADYWFVAYYNGEEQLGIYSIAVKLAQLFWILPVLFAGILFPGTAGQKEIFNEASMLSLLRVMNVFNIFIALLSLLLIDWLIPVFFGNAYEKGSIAFKGLLPGIFLFCNTTVIAAYFAGKNRLKINLFGSFLCFVSIIIADLLLIPAYKILGAALASSIGYTITTIYFLWIFLYKSPYKLTDIFGIRKDDWKRVLHFSAKPNTDK